METGRPGHPLSPTRVSASGKADWGLPFPLPTCYFKTCPPHSLPQQNEIQLIQLKQFGEQLLKVFNVR